MGFRHQNNEPDLVLQSCTLSVGSWTRSGWDVDIRTMNLTLYYRVVHCLLVAGLGVGGCRYQNNEPDLVLQSCTMSVAGLGVGGTWISEQ